MMLDQALRDATTIDPGAVDLEAADRVTYLLEQTFRYEYPQPVEAVKQRLVALPPARHGNQYLLAHRLDVDGASARRESRLDSHGNTVVRLRVDRVEDAVQFRIGALLERVHRDGPVRLPSSALHDPRLLRPTRLTEPDDHLRALAGELAGPGTARDQAERICAAVHSALTYEYGITSVRTTAAEALAGGRGVCQDSAHIMLALCRLLGLPARYVSGHLIGQGGTHAWVEVIAPHDDHAIALPFDPCNGVAASARYLTVATGRDYSDVAPTSGSYVGPPGGRLTTDRRLAVLAAA